jgi:hypothetical protein
MRYLILFWLLPLGVFAQKHDNVWLFGYNSNLGIEGVEGIKIDFQESPPSITYYPINYGFRTSNASFSDSEGNLLFYTNGCSISNTDHEIIINGDGLNPGEVNDLRCPEGYIAGIQSCLVLPSPEIDTIFYLFHKGVEIIEEPQVSLISNVFYYTKIKYDPNNFLLSVEEKNVPLIVDSLSAGQLTAVKHANGQDWFLLVPKFLSNKYYTLKLSAQGIEFMFEQEIGNPTLSTGDGGGQAVFSPNGNKYVRYTPQDGLFIFDFDRMTGLLSNFKFISINDGAFVGGVAFSPNSKLLYVSSETYLYQYNLESNDIESSKLLIDTFDGYTSPFQTTFFNAQLAPDCKIYINTFATVDVLHVIHNPNELGPACNFEQHAVQLPFNHRRSLPHFPNYRLGPLVPGEDPPPPCETIVDVEEVPSPPASSFSIYPNPAYDFVTIERASPWPRQATLVVRNLLGQVVLEQRIGAFGVANSKQRVDISALPKGVYLVQVYEEGIVVEVGKVVKG